MGEPKSHVGRDCSGMSIDQRDLRGMLGEGMTSGGVLLWCRSCGMRLRLDGEVYRENAEG